MGSTSSLPTQTSIGSRRGSRDAANGLFCSGRVIPVVRTFISLPAGMAKMNPLRFVALTTIGCAAWVAALSVIGYEVGGQWQSVTKGFSDASYVVAAIAVVIVAAFVWHRLRAVRREAGSGTSGHGHRAKPVVQPSGPVGIPRQPQRRG